MQRKLLIIGAGMATAYLLEALHKHAHQLDITVAGDERDYCYNRVMLSNVLSGEIGENELQMLDARQAPRATFLTNTRIEHVDFKRRRAFDRTGRGHSFDILVFATGSSVARPAVDCAGISGIEVFRTMDDTRHLRGLDSTDKRALVVGAGLLGLEAAHGLNELGFETCVLHRNPVIMNRQLDSEGAAQLRRDLENRGIGFCLEASIAELLTQDQQITGVVLDNGRSLDCDLLLFATGITPNAQLAADAGLDIDRGIRVDDYLHTSHRDVFALGECTQLGRHCFGLVAPIRDQARVLAAELAGQPTAPFAIEDWPTQLKISGIDIYRAGDLDDAAEQLILRDDHRGIYRRLVIRNNRLVGAVLVGDKAGGTWYSELIHNQHPIDTLRADLMFGREALETMQLSASAA